MSPKFFYDFFFILSVALAGIYVFKWHKHFSVYFNLIFLLIPLSNLGYVFLSHSHNLEEAILANKIIYVGGTFNMLFITLSIFKLCHITLNNILRLLMFTVALAAYVMILTIGSYPVYYKSVSFIIDETGAGRLINKVYGWGHKFFFVMVITFAILAISALTYSIKLRKTVSRRIVHLLFVSEIVTVVSFFFKSFISEKVELIPVAYCIAEVMYLVIIYKICLYDITESGIDSVLEKGQTGFVSFDFRYNYLGSNTTARKMMPELKSLEVDKPLTINEKVKNNIIPWLESFKNDNKKDKHHYKKGDKIYLIDVNYLVDGKRKRGYQLVITDDTKDQKYIELLGKFNTSLQEQVNRKTAHIIEMHNNLIMGMATMVESRDNSTGGHIKRTSEGVRILINEINESKTFQLSKEFCKNIIKAAPMHDLGKIAVKDDVLGKPGKFTPKEFEEMKKHAVEGARIVHEILKTTDDADFKIIAENVAHYHHERWDGSGYPEGLKGDKIPIEARIMAIADVYDALVSKRVYKDSMSFEEADRIIMEGFGKHFDKRLEPCYVSARPKLEEYYNSVSIEINE